MILPLRTWINMAYASISNRKRDASIVVVGKAFGLSALSNRIRFYPYDIQKKPFYVQNVNGELLSLIKEHENAFFSDAFYTQNNQIKLLTDHGIVNRYNGLNLYFTIQFQYAEQLMKNKILHLSSPLA